MKWFNLWDCVELDGSRWQIIAAEDDRYVLRSLDGPGVRILLQGDLFAGAVPDPRTDQTSGCLANLDLTSMLSYEERERIDVLADHLHEVWHGVRSRAPIGTRPRPEYDPTTQTLLDRKQAKAVELAAVGTPLSARQIDRYLRRWRTQGKAGLIDPRRLPLPQSRTSSELITLVEDALAAQKNRSSGTRRRVLLQVSVEAAELGVEVPSQATMYRLMDRLDRQRHSFGDAPTRRSLASRPDRTFGRQTPLRPGELTEIDGPASMSSSSTPTVQPAGSS